MDESQTIEYGKPRVSVCEVNEARTQILELVGANTFGFELLRLTPHAPDLANLGAFRLFHA